MEILVLHQGGELGYHGYNHQPLCLGDTDYGDVLPYKTWKNEKAMESAMSELMRFGKKNVPGNADVGLCSSVKCVVRAGAEDAGAKVSAD